MSDDIERIISELLAKEKIHPNPIHIDFESHLNDYTICEVLREIYSLTNDEGIKQRCILAQIMAKKMSRKLQENYMKEHPERSNDWTEGKFFPKKKKIVGN